LWHCYAAVTDLTVPSFSFLVCQVQLHNSVADVKVALQNAEGCPPDQQRLIFEGRHLEDPYTLAHYGVQEGSTIHWLLRLTGC